jgi:hydrogenase maturation protein HypF
MRAQKIRQKISVNGIVQGVGFRPFIYNLAHKHQLTGFVANTSTGVEIEVQGLPSDLDRFLDDLGTEAPPLSVITDVRSQDILTRSDRKFTIRHSDGQAGVATLISPDVAICENCLRELFDPADRRYLYPFINCTNCGPRYTIIENIPYDRPFTSMKSFTMCSLCQAEYDDPPDRRFHAQPNACPECGPSVTIFNSERQACDAPDPVSHTAELLKAGKIVAIKGLGGFHLGVDATNAAAVTELRKRKGREEKPLAVMVGDLVTAHRVCQLTAPEQNTLLSFQHPIVLACKRPAHGLAETIAPGNDRLGIMLPYTPLHHILFHYGIEALVMTSANYTEEPICIDNDEAFARLAGIADYFLIHDRDIYFRNDDSVVIHLNGKMRQIRRSRGYVPGPVFVSSQGPPVLAVGGHLKNTICLLKDNRAFLSQHIGDMENLEACNFFRMTVNHLERIFETVPELVVYDIHPGYLTTRWAREQTAVPTFGVQHHHAHLASCMAENRLEEPVIGIILDGTGYGTDGTIWGGEILIGDYQGFDRYAHFEPVALPGGDAAIKAPWRTAVSYLHHSLDGQLPQLPFLKEHDFHPVVEMVSKNINSPLTSSCGRLFDAVAAMSGGRQEIRYEGQAAIEFMQLASDLEQASFDFEITKGDDHSEMLVSPIIRAVVHSIREGRSIAEISAMFHRTLINLFTRIAVSASEDTGIGSVVLSGGVFQNQILFNGLIPSLESVGLQVFAHSLVPPNDGGLSFGQAMIGRSHLRHQ